MITNIHRVNQWRKKGNISRLVNALNCSDSEVRKAAALSLGELGDPNAIQHLELAMDKDLDFFVKKDMERAIVSIRSKTIGTYTLHNDVNISMVNIYDLQLKQAH